MRDEHSVRETNIDLGVCCTIVFRGNGEDSLNILNAMSEILVKMGKDGQASHFCQIGYHWREKCASSIIASHRDLGHMLMSAALGMWRQRLG
jgi:hypothetical protein